MAKQTSITQDGTILEALSNARFRVELVADNEAVQHVDWHTDCIRVIFLRLAREPPTRFE